MSTDANNHDLQEC